MQFKLEVVVVPVSDVDRAKAFYADQVGFPVDVDHAPNEHFRVVQMTPRGLRAARSRSARAWRRWRPGRLKGLQLCVADIEAAHALLAGRGVAGQPVQHHDGTGFVDGKGDDWNSFFFFSDPDGNGWAVQESPTMR